MSRIKFSTLATVTIFFLGAFASVLAQKARDGGPIPAVEPLNGTYTMKVSANELSPGDSKFEIQETVGWTSYGKTDGDLSGFMFISMNYTLPKLAPKDPLNLKDDRPEPIPQTSQVTGGSWSKLIFKNDQYVGSVYGRIVSGEIIWSQTDLNASMRLELVADDGTGLFVSSKGKGMFQGALDRMSQVTTVSGELTLNY